MVRWRRRTTAQRARLPRLQSGRNEKDDESRVRCIARIGRATRIPLDVAEGASGCLTLFWRTTRFLQVITKRIASTVSRGQDFRRDSPVLVTQSLNHDYLHQIKLAINQWFWMRSQRIFADLQGRLRESRIKVVLRKEKRREEERYSICWNAVFCHQRETRAVRCYDGAQSRKWKWLKRWGELRYTCRFTTPVISRRFTALFYTRYAHARATCNAAGREGSFLVPGL